MYIIYIYHTLTSIPSPVVTTTTAGIVIIIYRPGDQTGFGGYGLHD